MARREGRPEYGLVVMSSLNYPLEYGRGKEMHGLERPPRMMDAWSKLISHEDDLC